MTDKKNTKRQHYVPQTYMKAWETNVSSKAGLGKEFKCIYAFENDSVNGDCRNKDSVMWEPHLYTISFEQSFIDHKCPLIREDFIKQVFQLMKDRKPQSVYGKLGYSIIKTQRSVRKHLDDIYKWEFYYSDGNKARNRAIFSDIEALNSYLIEDGLDSQFETNWNRVLDTFITEMKDPKNAMLGKSERTLPKKVVEDLAKFIFMMYCRSPKFDGLGIYTWLKKDILDPVFGDYSKVMMNGEWHSEMYGMIYKENGGHFNLLYKDALDKCQMILFETYEGAGSFITSDNPIFTHKSSAVEINNQTGLIFPLTPKYLIFVGRGSDGYNTVDYRYANRDVIRNFNQMIYRNKITTVISIENSLNRIL